MPTGSIGEMRRGLDEYLSKHPKHKEEQAAKVAFGQGKTDPRAKRAAFERRRRARKLKARRYKKS